MLFRSDLFPDIAYIPSVVASDSPVATLDSPVDFSVQPPDITDPFPSSPFNEQVENEQVEDELPNPNLELGSPAPAPLEDLAQDIPPRHSTQVIVVFLAITKLKRGICVMIMSLIVFVSPSMLSFGNIASLSSSLTSVPPYLPPLS